MFTHHVVLAKHLGLDRIPEGFVVHHIDNNKSNNDVNNLCLMTRQSHSKLHQIERAETKRVRSRATDSLSDE